MSKRKAPISHNINVANAKATHTISVDPTKESPFYTESFFKRYWLPSIILVILSFGIYYACLPYDYVLDDKIVASENQYVKEGFSGIKKIVHEKTPYSKSKLDSDTLKIIFLDNFTILTLVLNYHFFSEIFSLFD